MASTYWCSSVTSGNSLATSITVARQSCETSSTLALSTLVSFLRRFWANWKAMRATRATSSRV